MRQMCDAALQGDKETALGLNERLMPVHRTLFIESINPGQVGLCPTGLDCQIRFTFAIDATECFCSAGDGAGAGPGRLIKRA